MNITKLSNGTQHIEAEGCIVNIQEGLHDYMGKKVTAITIIPDDRFAGEKVWELKGHSHNRVVQTGKIFR